MGLVFQMQVLEETGYDLGDALREEDAVEVHIGQKRTKLYIVAGVAEDTHFAPQVRKVRTLCVL
jgi:mRNA-decapping enzyme subunit 2